ncbi:MAG: hypothetical protein ISR22_01980 [Candidatus Poseidoniaceae archaeon]|nr:hypothetical protein [Candidatus Poseidoniaceae archaeon]
MSAKQQKFGDIYRPDFKVLLLVTILMTSTLINVPAQHSSSWDSQEPIQWNNNIDFSPQANQSHINTTVSSMIEVPANHTLTSGQVDVSPIWQKADSDGTVFDTSDIFWNGSYQQTTQSSRDGQLRLERNSSIGDITDFETTTVVPSEGWSSNGKDSNTWTIISPSPNAIISQSGMSLPDEGYNGSAFLSTSDSGDLNSSMHSCLRSPSLDMPRMINNFSISFDHWLALDSTDAAWVELLDVNGNWIALTPINGVSQSSSLQYAPSVVWTGESNSWSRVEIMLDSHVSSTQDSLNLQLCYETSNLSVPRGGWFVDQLSIFNEGEHRGAFFHGNLTGDYLPNSNSKYIIPMNFSSIPTVDEIEISMSWDVQGYLYDYLTVEYSIDNGSSWNFISGNYGIPGTGIWHNGIINYGESNGWVPIFMNLNYNFSNSSALNNTLVRISVITDSSVNFGGKVSSEWEGFAIDNIILHSGRNGPNPSSVLHSDFSTMPNLSLGSQDGWLMSYGTTQSQWQWTDTLGVDSMEVTNFSFDKGNILPAGWSLISIDQKQWQVGTIPNGTTYGPSMWPSGQQGAGTYLGGPYRNEMLTHLYSPEYFLPVGASSRLSFKSWVCTEANWDGGAVSISTDGGLNWWYIPPAIGTFHDQISTINSNSPFYGEGILDGSTIPGGCQNAARPFDDKVFETTNLSGENIRFRYSFFSDQLLEFDGWYIDDAGIEIDIFELQGTWTSPIVSPNPMFGWGHLDGFVQQPDNTSIRFDILDINNNTIDGYTNQSLPIDIQLDPEIYPNLRIRANLTTSNELVSPSIEFLSIGFSTYFDAYHYKNMANDSRYSGSYSHLSLNGDNIFANQVSYLRIQTTSFCPQIGTQMSSVGDNISLYSSQFGLDSTYFDTEISNFRVLNFSNNQQISSSLTDSVQLTLLTGQKFTKFAYHPICAKSPISPEVGLGNQNQSIFSWPVTNSGKEFGITTEFSSITSNGITNYSNVNGAVELELLDGQQVQVDYKMLLSVNGHQVTGNQNNHVSTSFLINLVSQSSISSLSHSTTNDVIIASTNELSVVHSRVVSPEVCPNFTFPNGLISDDYGIASCTINLSVSGNMTARFSNLQSLSPVQKVQLEIGHSMLNEIKNNSYQGNDRELLYIPMTVETVSGSININMTTTSYLHQIDTINSISRDRWLPEQIISINTSHIRFDPVTMSEHNHQLEKVKLILSPNPIAQDSIIEIEVSNLYSSKDISIIKGSNLIQLEDGSTSVNCIAGFCQIQWMITSTWQLDDIDDIHWMVVSQDTSGLETGPDLLIRQTAFNEVENDLEIIQFEAFDDENALHDWTDADWPFHIQSNESITVNGQVRFQGVSNNFILPDQARIEVKLQAVPPKNISGGQDVWPDAPINWSDSWFIEVGVNGYFSTIINTPDSLIIPSNTSLEISAHIVRIGPIGQQSNTSNDMTAIYQKTRILFDIESPEVISLDVLDPGGQVPADEHVWISGQDIPLRATISDVEGLSPLITVWSWSESKDDLDGDGVMDLEEYVSTTATVNTGSKSAIVDLPIFSWFDVRGSKESGMLSIFIESQDLAGNLLSGGGSFGEGQDLATVIVQNQYTTFFDFDTLDLDLIEQQILPGFEHKLQFSLTDANGIDSLDEIQLAILGRDTQEQCFIHHSPRFSNTQYDSDCFVVKPEVIINQQEGFLVWDIEFNFRVSWQITESLPQEEWIPSVKIFDEGQDLYLGVSLLTMFEWTFNNNIEFSHVEILEQSGPIGSNTGQEIWLQSNDIIGMNLYLEFINLSIPVQYLNDYFSITGVINNQTSNQLENMTFNDQGPINVEFIAKPSYAESAEFSLELRLFSPQLQPLASRTLQVYLDDSPPIFSLSLQDLLKVDSNRLSEIPIFATISDDIPLNEPRLEVNWFFSENDSIIQGTSGSQIINSTEITQFNTYFDAFIDITPSDESLFSRDSEIVIWFAATDNSGLELTGFGTSSDPLKPRLNWIDFEPQLDTVRIETKNPTFGQNLEIITRIVNTGQLNGTVQVELIDLDGMVLETKFITIEAGDWIETSWYFEAWTTGDITFFVNLTNYSQSKQVEIEDIDEFESSNRELNGLIGLIGLFIFLVVGGFGFAYHRRSKELDQYTKLHIENIVRKKRSAPPRPLELDDYSEE